MKTGKVQPDHGKALHWGEAEDAARARLEQLIDAGLCSNCRHMGDCTMLLKNATPVTQCEMHECGPSPRPRLTLVTRPAAGEDAGGPDGEELLGLCANCDHLKNCRLPKPPGGVWQCEEFA
ncbi:MAG: hypothetical protein MUF46_10780 [Desulfobacterales bacterium]|jgi:hypothetical protein|nr:hypothetical protein [Desulfobacterales bacterium]